MVALQSHRLHHMYHNHLTKDMSHPWLTKVRQPALDRLAVPSMPTPPWPPHLLWSAMLLCP